MCCYRHLSLLKEVSASGFIIRPSKVLEKQTNQTANCKNDTPVMSVYRKEDKSAQFDRISSIIFEYEIVSKKNLP